MSNAAALASAALSETDGILRLAPNWVPRSFLQPGRRLKLHPDHYYALGMHRGGIDERWFGSTTEAANDNRNWDEGLSYCVAGGEKFLLRDAVDGRTQRRRSSAMRSGTSTASGPVYSKFFDNMGPIPHHMHQNAEQAAKVGQEGKPESLLLPAADERHREQTFPYTFMGLRARHDEGTGRRSVSTTLEQRRERYP